MWTFWILKLRTSRLVFEVENISYLQIYYGRSNLKQNCMNTTNGGSSLICYWRFHVSFFFLEKNSLFRVHNTIFYWRVGDLPTFFCNQYTDVFPVCKRHICSQFVEDDRSPPDALSNVTVRNLEKLDANFLMMKSASYKKYCTKIWWARKVWMQRTFGFFLLSFPNL